MPVQGQYAPTTQPLSGGVTGPGGRRLAGHRVIPREAPIYFNVRNAPFGAVGDGVADDTNALDNALAAAERVGGVLYLPPGTYARTGVMNISASVKILGAGQDSVITYTAAALNLPLLSIDADDVQLENFRVLGSGVVNALEHGIRITGVRADISLLRVTVEDAGASAVSVENAADPNANRVEGLSIVDCQAINCARGISLIYTNTQNVRIENFQVSYGAIQTEWGIGIDRNVDYVQIDGGDIEAFSHGIMLASAQFVEITGVRIHDIADPANGYGINVSTTENFQQTRCVQIVDCNVQVAASHGILVTGTAPAAAAPMASRHVWLRDCYVSGNGDDGIHVEDVEDMSVVDCKVAVNDAHGLQVLGNGNGIDPLRFLVRGGRYYNNGQVAANSRVIQVGANVDGIVERPDTYDDQTGVETQEYGVWVGSAIDLLRPKGDGNTAGLLFLNTRPRSLDVRYDFQTTDASNYDLVFCNLDANQEGCLADINVSAVRDAGGNDYAYWVKQRMHRTGGAVAATGGVDTGTVNAGTGATLANSVQISGDDCLIRSAGNVGENWNWTITIKTEAA